MSPMRSPTTCPSFDRRSLVVPPVPLTESFTSERTAIDAWPCPIAGCACPDEPHSNHSAAADSCKRPICLHRLIRPPPDARAYLLRGVSGGGAHLNSGPP